MKVVKLREVLLPMTTKDASKLKGTNFKYIDVDAVEPNHANIVHPKDLLIVEAPSRAKRGVKCGDVIISLVRAYQRKIALITELNEECIVSTAFYVCRPNKELHSKYLFYFLGSRLATKYLESKTQGDNSPSVRNEDFLNLEIPLPNVKEQERIAIVLEKAQLLVKKRKEAIAKIDELVQSVFLYMFGDLSSNPKGWPIMDFKYFANIDTKMVKNFEEFGEYPHIGIDNIEKDTGRLVNYKTVSEENLSSGKYLFSDEHIIYSKIRPYLNKVAIPDFSGLCSADAYPIKVNKDRTNRYFFAYIMRSKVFLEHVEHLSNRTNIPKVNKTQLESFSCIAPPKELQDEFSRIVLNVQIQEQRMQQSLLALEQNFQAILQRAFKGELFVH